MKKLALAIFRAARKVGFHSARARDKAGFVSRASPMPDAGSFWSRNSVADLVGQHQNLAAMMRLVREHVKRTWSLPAGHVGIQLSRENFATRGDSSGRESIPIQQCAGTRRRFLLCAAAALLHRAAVGIEWRRTHSDAELLKPDPLAADICRCAERLAALSGGCVFDPAAGANMARGSRCKRC